MIALVLLLLLGGLMQSVRAFVPEGMPVGGADGTELAFGFVVLTALFAGRLVSRLAMPRVTGYLVAGIVTGPWVLALLSHDMVHALRFVNGVAICLIALTAGGELRVAEMRPLARTIGWMTVSAVLGTALLTAGGVMALRPWLPWLAELPIGVSVAIALVVGVTLASQSPAVVMALLAETRSDGPLSRVTLGLVVVADLVVIILYAVVASVANGLLGAGGGPLETALGVAWELFGSIAVGVALGGLLALYLRKVVGGVGLFVLLVCAVVSEVGTVVHLDPLIVCLTAGIFLENVARADASALIHDMEAASLPVYLVFFAVAGASLDLDALSRVAAPAVVLVVIRGLGLWLGGRWAAKHTGAAPAVVQWAWTGLLPQAGLALALALIMARTFGELGREAAVLVLGVVAINQLVGPVLMRLGLVQAGETGRRAAAEFAGAEEAAATEPGPQPETAPASLATPESP